MRDALPYASFIGVTRTPVELKEGTVGTSRLREALYPQECMQVDYKNRIWSAVRWRIPA
jgi:hypothetical protein